MKLDEKWDRFFSSASLCRGYNYYLDDRVFKVQKNSNGWTAMVRGSEDYDVFVPDDAHGDKEPYCSCPHYADGYYCKHLAATCFEIKHLVDLEAEERDAALEKQGARGTDIEALVCDLPDDELRSFLLEALRENERLNKRFVGMFAELDINRLRCQLRFDIERVTFNYTRHEFIEYRDVPSFCLDFSEVVHINIDPLIERKAYREAFDLTGVVLLCLQNIQVDDPDDFFADALSLCEDYWTGLLAQADQALKRLLFEWLLSFVRQNPFLEGNTDVYWREQDCVEEFLVDTFGTDPDYAQEIIQLSEERIVECLSCVPELPLFVSSQHYTLGKWTLVKLRSMKTLGASQQDLELAAIDAVDCEDVRQFLVHEALNCNDINRAIELLIQTKETGRERCAIEASTQLLEIYERLHDTKRAQRELMFLLTHDTSSDSGRKACWFNRLKDLSSSSEWPKMRNQLFSSMNSEDDIRTCLAEENMCAELKRSIEKSGDFYEMQRFEEVLQDHYADWILNQYSSRVKQMLQPVSNRFVYSSAARLMLRMQAIPGGASIVDELVATFRKNYSRRRALMQELQILD